MGAGGVAASAERPDPLVFSSASGPDALGGLNDELARAGLQPQDMLRLRLFSCDDEWITQTREQIEGMLPRPQWPAISPVQLSHGSAGEGMFDGSPGEGTLDVIAAGGGRHKQATVHGTVRFGDWVFVGALCGSSPPELPLKERIERESRQVFADMERLLGTAGAELRDVVRVGGWLGFPMSGYEPLAQVRHELLERRGLLPASAAVQVHHTGAEPARHMGAGHVRRADAVHVRDANEPLLAFEAIAFAGPPGRRPTPSSLAPYYAAARSAGGYVFTCGEIAREGGALHRQVGDVCEQLSEHLATQGAAGARLVQSTAFVRRTQDAGEVQHGLKAHFGVSEIPITVVHAADMGFRPGVNVEIELVADAR